MCLRSGSLISFWGFSDKGLLYLALTLERRVESKSSPEGFFSFLGWSGRVSQGRGNPSNQKVFIDQRGLRVTRGAVRHRGRAASSSLWLSLSWVRGREKLRIKVTGSGIYHNFDDLGCNFLLNI